MNQQLPNSNCKYQVEIVFGISKGKSMEEVLWPRFQPVGLPGRGLGPTPRREDRPPKAGKLRWDEGRMRAEGAGRRWGLRPLEVGFRLV
jgi:hypothetical protein